MDFSHSRRRRRREEEGQEKMAKLEEESKDVWRRWEETVCSFVVAMALELDYEGSMD